MIETPATADGTAMDLIGEIVGGMRLSGGVILDAEFRSPWRVLSYLGPEDCAPFFPVPQQIIAYHYVKSGSMWAQVGDAAPVAVGPGEIVLFPRNARHILFSHADVESVDAHSLIRPGESGAMARISWGAEGGECCNMYCGYLGSENPDPILLSSLPPMLKIAVSDDIWSDWMESSLRLAASGGAGGAGGMAGIAEMLFAEAVRLYLDTLPADQKGWLSGLRDPPVSRALGIIHASLSEPLDMEKLAREAGLSRSALNARFTAMVGEPPIRYWTRRRLHLAAELLASGQVNASEAGFRVGFGSEPAFSRAFKREYGTSPSAWRRSRDTAMITASPGPAHDQQVVHCTAADGTRLAYSCVGEGPPLVKTANWLNHLEHEWESPIWRHWLRELTGGHKLLRYDQRGNGLSDWDVDHLSFDAFVSDLEIVVDAAGIDRFDMIGISQGAAVAIAYAVRHPDRVRRLVLVGGYAAGWALRGDPEVIRRREAMITLTATGWGQDDPTFRQLFTRMYLPGATDAEVQSFNELQRVSVSPEGAERLQRAFGTIDVRHLLPRVKAPTLVFHSLRDRAIPLDAGEALAAGIHGATFVPLDSDNHILLEHEPAWPLFLKTLRDFLADHEVTGPDPAGGALRHPQIRT